MNKEHRGFGLVLLLCGVVTQTSAQVVTGPVLGYSVRSIPLVQPITLAYIASPFHTADNRLSSFLPNVPNGTMVYAYRGNTFEAYTFYDGWFPSDTMLAPGEGVILALDQRSAPNPTSLVFVGGVVMGTVVNNPLPPGFSLKASQALYGGRISSDLGLNARDGDSLILFDQNTQTENFYFFFDPIWFESEPQVLLSQAFWYFNDSGTPNQWSQSIFPPAPAVSEAVAAAPPPSDVSGTLPCLVGQVLLDIVRWTPSQVRVSWPREFDWFRLEHLNGAGGWIPFAQPPDTIHGRRGVTLIPDRGGDAFRLNSGPLGPAPSLFWKVCGASTLTLYWYGGYTGYRVEHYDGGVFSGVWTPVPQPATLANGFWQVTVSPGPARLYRLGRP